MIPQASGAPPDQDHGLFELHDDACGGLLLLAEHHRNQSSSPDWDELRSTSAQSCRLPLTGWFGVTGSDADRKLAAEQAEIAEIVQGVSRAAGKAAAKQTGRSAVGPTRKACACERNSRSLTLPPAATHALAARLAKGIFARPGIYPATVRFSNSDPNGNSDFKPDVRALSFAVDLAPAGMAAPDANTARQDFSHAKRDQRCRSTTRTRFW